MANVASNSISVFPTVNRTQSDVFGRSQRLFTEQNVANIAKMLSSKDGYVIGKINVVNGDVTADAIAFVIGGYYVEVLVSALPTGTVYASLNISNGVLDSDNASSEYAGISFDTTSSTGALLLGVKSVTASGDTSVTTFTIAPESQYMYDGSKVDVIDGGTI